MKEFIDKLIERLEEEKEAYSDTTYYAYGVGSAIKIVNELAEEINKGSVSDGYHTFDELYHHRAVLFSVICNSNKEFAWKSKLHDTGDMYEGMFIVGIETPEGQATYHYDINPYWDMFKVKELPKAPKWDGHSPDEAIRRLSLLAEEFAPDIYVGTKVQEMPTGWIPCSERLPKEDERILCLHSDGFIDCGVLVGETWCCDMDEYSVIRDDIHAWMPLPATFKEGE